MCLCSKRTYIHCSYLHLLFLTRETVVIPDLVVQWDLLVPLDPLDPPEVLEDLETVERL